MIFESFGALTRKLSSLERLVEGWRDFAPEELAQNLHRDLKAPTPTNMRIDTADAHGDGNWVLSGSFTWPQPEQ